MEKKLCRTVQSCRPVGGSVANSLSILFQLTFSSDTCTCSMNRTMCGNKMCCNVTLSFKLKHTGRIKYLFCKNFSLRSVFFLFFLPHSFMTKTQIVLGQQLQMLPKKLLFANILM